MTRILLISTFLLCGSFRPLLSQQDFNATLIDQRNDFSDLEYADVWGYASTDGTEYAVIGTRAGVAIYQLLVNGQLKLLQHVPGDVSLWRDIKSYGDYIYAIADEGDDGLVIINMKQAPQVITWNFWRPQLQIGGEQKFLNECHNLWVDEKGALYLAGCNINKGGVLIADLTDNPEQPQFMGAGPAVYSHDCFVRNDILWSAELSEGQFAAYDISDKGAPVRLAAQKTGARFTHNVWLSDDNKYLFTTDERPNAAVEVYDVSDLDNIRFLDAYRPAATLGSGVIPHNVHYYRGWLVISYYTDGVKIVDANRPGNLVEVGSYDTWPGPHGNYRGCWGAFPFLPSGLILASNIEDGLYVLRPEYKRACYLEGKVTDAVSGARLNDVQVEILSGQTNIAFSNLTGEYKTGQYPAGDFEIVFTKEGYERKTATARLENGQATILDVQLTPLRAYTLQGRVRDNETGRIVPQAIVTLRNDLSFFQTKANDQGQFSIPGVYAQDYRVFAAAWGYRYLELANFPVDNAGPYDLEMERGYQDDFLFDLGWTTEQDENATAGFWEWGEPKGTTAFGTAANPFDDLPDDYGDHCYVTGNLGGTPNRDDVDNGAVRLISPPMDLSDYQDPLLTYYLWFFNTPDGGDDTLKVFLSDGEREVLIEQLTAPFSGWREQSQIRALDHLSLDKEIRLILEAADQPDSDHVVEAAIDGFAVLDNGQSTPVEDVAPALVAEFNVFPNPSAGAVTLDYRLNAPVDALQVEIFNIYGQVMYRQSVPVVLSGRMALPEMETPGLYFLRLLADDRPTPARKVIWKD
jgi:choice-of-anchor B domain-containing protein